MANKVYTLFDTEIENDNLFEIDIEENENKNEKLLIKLFQELEVELLDSLLHREKIVNFRKMKLMGLLIS